MEQTQFVNLSVHWGGGGQLRIKMDILQRHKSKGGLSVPNLKFYFRAFVLRPLSTWLNPEVEVSWKPIEENLASPHRLEDLIYSNIPLKQSKLHLGPIISFPLSTWRTTEKKCKTILKWHLNSPVFNNCFLVTWVAPFSSSTWTCKGVHKLADIFNEKGLRSFNDIRASYDLPGSSFFLYLQLRSSLKAYGVPWNEPLKTHQLHSVLFVQGQTSGLVSKLYSLFSVSSYKPLHIERVWTKDLEHLIMSHWTGTSGNV